MKQGKLIRRAVSAALAGCMMFTFSAPALAESTDALMQLSMTRRSAVSVLDEENDEDVQDYGLEVGGESTTPTRVTSKNYKDILNKGVLSYDPTTQTLKSNGKLPRSLQKINAPGKDIELKGENSSTVTDKLIVVKAHNVTISSDEYDAIFSRGDTSTINCTGKVDIRSDKNRAVNGSLNIYDSSEVILSAGYSVVTDNANITSEGNVTIESTDGRAAKNLTINKAENVTITISDDERAVSENTKITASGTVILKNTAEGGRVGTVDFTQADGKKYVYYQVALHKPQFLHQPQSSAGICAFGSPDEKFLT